MRSRGTGREGDRVREKYREKNSVEERSSKGEAE